MSNPNPAVESPIARPQNLARADATDDKARWQASIAAAITAITAIITEDIVADINLSIAKYKPGARWAASIAGIATGIAEDIVAEINADMAADIDAKIAEYNAAMVADITGKVAVAALKAVYVADAAHPSTTAREDRPDVLAAVDVYIAAANAADAAEAAATDESQQAEADELFDDFCGGTAGSDHVMQTATPANTRVATRYELSQAIRANALHSDGSMLSVHKMATGDAKRRLDPDVLAALESVRLMLGRIAESVKHDTGLPCPCCGNHVEHEPEHNSPEIDDVSAAGYYCEMCAWQRTMDIDTGTPAEKWARRRANSQMAESK